MLNLIRDVALEHFQSGRNAILLPNRQAVAANRAHVDVTAILDSTGRARMGGAVHNREALVHVARGFDLRDVHVEGYGLFG